MRKKGITVCAPGEAHGAVTLQTVRPRINRVRGSFKALLPHTLGLHKITGLPVDESGEPVPTRPSKSWAIR